MQLKEKERSWLSKKERKNTYICIYICVRACVSKGEEEGRDARGAEESGQRKERIEKIKKLVDRKKREISN